MGWLDEDINVNKASELAEEEAEKQGGGGRNTPTSKGVDADKKNHEERV